MEHSLTTTTHALVHNNTNLQDDLSVTKLITHFHKKLYFKNRWYSIALGSLQRFDS